MFDHLMEGGPVPLLARCQDDGGDDDDDGGDDDEDIAETKDVHCSTSGWPVNWREWPTVTPQNSVKIHSSDPPLFTVCSKTASQCDNPKQCMLHHSITLQCTSVTRQNSAQMEQ